MPSEETQEDELSRDQYCKNPKINKESKIFHLSLRFPFSIPPLTLLFLFLILTHLRKLRRWFLRQRVFPIRKCIPWRRYSTVCHQFRKRVLSTIHWRYLEHLIGRIFR